MASWGRHGWARRRETFRLYKERNGAYLLLEVADDPREQRYPYSALANVLEGPEPSLASCNIPHSYTYDKGCKRVQWSELPQEWKTAFARYLDDKPQDIRGFWLVNNKERV